MNFSVLNLKKFSYKYPYNDINDFYIIHSTSVDIGSYIIDNILQSHGPIIS